MFPERRLTTHRTRLILISIFVVFTFGLFILILALKFANPFKVSIYNYESYLDKQIVNKLKKNYSYHVFTNLDEFTRAINNKKAVAGIGSDYQIAQLIYDKKLRKINFELAYGKKFNTDEDIKNNYPDLVNNQFNHFDNWIIEKIKKDNPQNNVQANWDKMNYDDFKPFLYKDEATGKITGFEIDGKPGQDHFYHFLIPYFILDKMIVYNTDKEPSDSTSRSNLKPGSTFDDVKSQTTWEDIIKTLASKYKKPRVYWTNWFQDNAMIGEFYGYESNKEPNYLVNGEWAPMAADNYKQIIDYFLKLVKTATSASIKDSNINKLVTDGQELVSSIIEPRDGKSDISIMYNGDALDAYYGKDNFERLGDDPHIGFIRPKHNYMNIDAWIISRDTDDEDANKLLKILHDNLFAGSFLSVKEIEKQYIDNVYKLLIENNNNENYYIQNLYKNSQRTEAKDISEITEKFFKENYDFFQEAFADESLPVINNFNTINYTPGFANVNSFLEKWYFLNDNKIVDAKALEIFNPKSNSTVQHRAYQPLDLELKTLFIDYYYQKTKS
ncbi:hypothetical protein [Metamycoplasma neophronis]|uniref:Spermidine/putrescine ABC transporter substrate-binding protein n=1 Tax=Metamycoplasma neophronis TaxID=872983 RepID=A0ABY2Z038_9BACT|nr:hypothetical protein [Metamycoplasma neophronis]TPR53884.1 hypothetical protein FJR74_01830 [Metamycoplasma neophronis]